MTSIFSERWIDIIFSGRNQEYGAYVLRKRSARYVIAAALISTALFSLSLAAPIIIKKFGLDVRKEEKIKVIEVTELLAPPPIDPTEPPPPPVEPPPPLKTTIKFTPPKIVKDEEVTEEDEPPSQEELKEAEAGAVTQEGDTAGVDYSLLEVTGNDVVGDPDADKIFQIVEQQPEYPGGEKELMKYLSSIKYPEIARENDIEGSVYVRFVVEKDGSITNVEVAKGADKILNEAAVAHVKKMKPWKPGKQNGKEVRVQYIVPIKFTLQ
ncbi:MAG TPA: TonB family protein [Chitinophagales bacterium]|nr:TonB family protein [Chitinophagales bacterium]